MTVLIEQPRENPEPILSAELIEFCKTTIANWHPQTLKIARGQVQPYLADSGFTFPMNGEVCYLSSDAPPLARIAAMALLLKATLPLVEANGNPTEVKYVAMALGLFSIALMYPLTGGKALDEAVAGYAEYKKDRRESRLGKTDLRNVPKMILEVAVAKHFRKNNWLQQTTADVNQYQRDRKETEVGPSTVSKELDLRGIAKPSTSLRRKKPN